MAECVAKFGVTAVRDCMEDVLTCTENLTRARLATVPDCDYTFADYLDDDGAVAPVRLTVTLRVRGERDRTRLCGERSSDSRRLQFAGIRPSTSVSCASNNQLRLERGAGHAIDRCHYAPLAVHCAHWECRESGLSSGCLSPLRDRCSRILRGHGSAGSAIPDRVPAAGSGAAAVVMVSVPDLESGGRQVAGLGTTSRWGRSHSGGRRRRWYRRDGRVLAEYAGLKASRPTFPS